MTQNQFQKKRRLFIAGNWKMNKNRAQTGDFFTEWFQGLPKTSHRYKELSVAFGVPFLSIEKALIATKESGVKILAQNCHFSASGAYTGEISTEMLKELCIHGSIIGHSERRQYFGESNECVGKKWAALADAGLLPIVCVGESKQEREAGTTLKIIERQLFDSLSQVNSQQRVKPFVIAYEPVWAIGTGLTATPEQAEDVHASIRKVLTQELGPEIADRTQILYGGSMNAENAKDLLSRPNIDGGLIGGASLKASDFLKIVESAIEVM